MNRILIIGSSGAGKTTLAIELGKILGLPVIHLDYHHWRPNWTVPPQDAWRAQVEELVKGAKWVMDGNFSGSLDIRIPAADTVIFMDFPRRVSLWRILMRWAIWHGRTRPDLAPDCPERWDWEFLRWVWDFPRNTRPTILKKISEYGADKKLVILKSPADVSRFLSDLGDGGGINGRKAESLG